MASVLIGLEEYQELKDEIERLTKIDDNVKHVLKEIKQRIKMLNDLLSKTPDNIDRESEKKFLVAVYAYLTGEWLK